MFFSLSAEDKGNDHTGHNIILQIHGGICFSLTHDTAGFELD